MKRNSTPIIIIIVIVLIIGLWMYLSSNKNKPIEYSTVPTNQVQQNTSTATPGVLFSGTPMSKNAYLISLPTYDAKTEKALSGFKVIKNDLADGSVEYVLSSQNKEYTTQSYVVRPGEKLYFIESNLSDDSNNGDKILGDDTAVVVDKNGYIVNQ